VGAGYRAEPPPRLHPGITQKVAPNESLRGPKACYVERANLRGVVCGAFGSSLDSAGLITHRTKVQSPPRDQAKSLDYDFHWVYNPTVRTGAFRCPGKRGVRSHRQSVSGVYLPSGPRSGRSGGRNQLPQIALRVLERRDPYGTVIRGILDELDPGVLQAFPVARKVVARETDHVSRRVGIPTMHLAVRAQPEPAEDYETGRFRGHLESQNVPIKCQQVIQVFAPDRCSAQPCDHRSGPSQRPVSAVWSNATPFDARNWPMGPWRGSPDEHRVGPS